MPTESMTVSDRFWSKVDGEGDCWEWTRGTTGSGYGKFWIDGRTTVAHRVAWEWLVGPIPDGMMLDHLCRNTVCVNPDHLEVVTPKENYLRGYGSPAMNARKVKCKNGHALLGDNLWEHGTYRYCVTCKRESVRRWRLRNPGKG